MAGKEPRRRRIRSDTSRKRRRSQPPSQPLEARRGFQTEPRADEHIAKAVLNGLRQRGVDVCGVADAEMRGATDVEQLAWALREGRAMVTHDGDFLRLHADGAKHAGIVHVAPQTSITELIRHLVLIAQVLTADDMVDHVEFV